MLNFTYRNVGRRSLSTSFLAMCLPVVMHINNHIARFDIRIQSYVMTEYHKYEENYLDTLGGNIFVFQCCKRMYSVTN